MAITIDQSLAPTPVPEKGMPPGLRLLQGGAYTAGDLTGGSVYLNIYGQPDPNVIYRLLQEHDRGNASSAYTIWISGAQPIGATTNQLNGVLDASGMLTPVDLRAILAAHRYHSNRYDLSNPLGWHALHTNVNGITYQHNILVLACNMLVAEPDVVRTFLDGM